MASTSSNFIGLVDSGYHAVDDGCRIYYEVHGKGEQKVVLIQGFHTSLLTWKYQVEYLASDAAGRYQVLLLDNRGYGRSDAPRGFYSTRRMAKDALSVLKNQLKWDCYHVLGQSMGGMVAQELALLDYRSILSLGLCVTHAGGLGAIPPLEGIAKSLVTVLAGMSSVAAHATSIMRLQYPEVWLDMMQEGDGTESLKETNRDRIVRILVEDLKWAAGDGRWILRGVVGQLGALSRHHVPRSKLLKLKSKLAAQGSPLLVIVGSEDLLVPIGNSDSLQALLECSIQKIPNTGHMLHYQAPYEFNTILQNHLSSAATSHRAESNAPKAKL